MKLGSYCRFTRGLTSVASCVYLLGGIPIQLASSPETACGGLESGLREITGGGIHGSCKAEMALNLRLSQSHGD